MKVYVIAAAACCAASFALAQGVVQPSGAGPRFPRAYKELAQQTKPPSNNWLLDANDDAERFRRLQVLAGGTDGPMWEIGHRYEEIYVAIQRNNPEMGVYHWEKVRDRMNSAGMKRPARTAGLEGMFLDNGVWTAMHEALTSKDRARMERQFLATRQACMGCHVAERVGFLNDSSVFARTASFMR